MARENKLETLKLFLLQAALKTLATILTVTTLIAGLSVAKAADRQAGEAAGGNELINPPTVPSVYAQAGGSHVSSQGVDFQLRGPLTGCCPRTVENGRPRGRPFLFNAPGISVLPDGRRKLFYPPGSSTPRSLLGLRRIARS